MLSIFAALFGLTVQLRQNDNRNIQFLGQPTILKFWRLRFPGGISSRLGIDKLQIIEKIRRHFRLFMRLALALIQDQYASTDDYLSREGRL